MSVVRLLPALAMAAAIIFACGPRSHSSEAPQRARTVNGPSIATSLNVRQRGKDIAFTFKITNNAKKRIELVFPNGQTHDFFVVDASGEEVWRWSEGRMFTQALQNRVLDANESVSYEVAWTPPAESSGSTLVAVASLLSENHPLEEKAEFSVP